MLAPISFFRLLTNPLCPLRQGGGCSLSLACRLRGCEEFWGLQRGQLGKCPLCRFRFLLRSKGRISLFSARKTKLCLGFFQGLRKKTLALCTQKEDKLSYPLENGLRFPSARGGRHFAAVSESGTRAGRTRCVKAPAKCVWCGRSDPSSKGGTYHERFLR